MSIEDPTFGCGEFLPGVGPGNFPDFTGGGSIDGGGGDTVPTWEGRPIDPGGPAPPGGGTPGQPGPPRPGPGAPGSGTRCRCKVMTTTVIKVPMSGGPGQCAGARYIVTFTQKCQGVPNGQQQHEPSSEDTVNAHYTNNTTDTANYTYGPPEITDGSPGDDQIGGENCNDDGKCTGPCPDIILEYSKIENECEDGGGTGATCYCYYPKEPTTIVEGSITTSQGQCILKTATFVGDCQSMLAPPPDNVQAYADEQAANATGNVTVEEGSATDPRCGQTYSPNCGGNCADKYVQWIECPGGTSVSPGASTQGSKIPGCTRKGDPNYNPLASLHVESMCFYHPQGEATEATGATVPIPGDITQHVDFTIGGGRTSKSSQTRGGLISDAAADGVINLDDPLMINNFLKKKPTGLQDADVAFLTTPTKGIYIRNETGHTDIFASRIDSNVSYVIRHQKDSGDWDSTKAAGVTPESVYSSLKDNIKKLLSQILNYDGTPLTRNQIYSIIGTRILDGNVSRITLKYLKNLAASSRKRNTTTIIRSSNNTVNDIAVAALIDKNKFTLDASKADGRMKNILPNWKTLATDVDMYFPFVIGGEEKKLYVNDDNTILLRNKTLKVQDGNYIDITYNSTKYKSKRITNRFFAKTELDHAFILSEKTKQKALNLLGAPTGRTLEINAPPSSSGIEFDYSLSAPRKNFYVLSAILSSIVTTPSPVGSFLLKDSTIRYDLVSTDNANELLNFNNYIKYKANHRVFVLDDEDLIFDYLDGLGTLLLKQTDIMFDAPKTNKNLPLLTRQIPWYILIYPTNRTDYNIFNEKSQLVNIADDGSTIRQLRCRTSIVPEFANGQTNKFVRIKTDGKNAVDVLGNLNTQARITQVVSTDAVFKTGYKDRDRLVQAKAYTRTRKKTGFRLIKEIITELDTNYLLELNGIGKSITEFDVFSRLYFKQFNILSKLENFTNILDAIRKGLFSQVKVIAPIRYSTADINYRNTLLVRRKKQAPADTFTAIKATNNRRTIVPPSTTGGATTAPVRSPTTP